MTNFYDLNFAELKSLCHQQGLIPSSASYLYNWYYKKNKRGNCTFHNLSKKTKSYFEENISFALPQRVLANESQDRTVKFLFELNDGNRVETVLIPFQKKYTVCLSSQVGCAMNCSFCHTGKQGLTRNLAAYEIVGQFLEVQRWLTENRPNDDRILNIVYMGQGEPLHNFDAVKTSAEIFMSQHGLSLAGSKITISTAGYLPGLLRWKNEMPDVNIALSLHAVENEMRSKIIPINRKYSLESVLDIVESIPTGKKRFVTYEYILLKNFNCHAEDAERLGSLLSGKKAFLNLIPVNAVPGSSFQRPDDNEILKFKEIIDKYKIPVTIRTAKGDEIMAACGQLNSKLSF